MGHRLFGLETEYGCTMLDGETPGGAPDLLLKAATQQLPYLPAASGGIFVSNGGRFYIDSGGHPEFSSPEVTTPWDVCRYIKAGDRIVQNSAQKVMAERPRMRVILNRANVCYDSPVTWACHESICHQVRHLETLQEQLIPHLVTRQIYTGGGGFDNRCAGLQFMISPRVAHIERQSGEASQSDRPIFHTKQEPLCEGYQRLHIICGETVCSELSQWLKSATTVLVVTLIEMGACPQGLFAGISPLAGMKRIATDESLQLRLGRAKRNGLTAIDIQYKYPGGR